MNMVSYYNRRSVNMSLCDKAMLNNFSDKIGQTPEEIFEMSNRLG